MESLKISLDQHRVKQVLGFFSDNGFTNSEVMAAAVLLIVESAERAAAQSSKEDMRAFVLNLVALKLAEMAATGESGRIPVGQSIPVSPGISGV